MAVFPFNLPVGQWGVAPSTGNYRISDVYPTNPGGTQAAICTAWNSGCFDTARKDLVIAAAGGHHDYAGNEVYAFSVNKDSANFLTWRRKTTASTRSDTEPVYSYPDGTISSRHTYAGMLYLPTQDVVMLSGGAIWGNGDFVRHNWWFDATTETPNTTGAGEWTQKTDTGTSGATMGTDKVYSASLGLVFSQEGGGLVNFNPADNTSTVLTTFESWGGITHANAALALTSPEKYVRVGNGHAWVRQVTSPYTITGSDATGVSSTGDTAIESVEAPGVVWDANGSQIVAWGGTLAGGTDNRDYYTFNVATLTWTRHAGTGDTPDNPQGNGTYGRFFYVGDGLCGLVNSTTSNVYFLRVAESLVPDTISTSWTAKLRRVS